jgi:DNA polymerase III delta prime subunit
MRLFGRESELAKLTEWVRAERSFIFYGPAGVGKTRLLEELEQKFPLMLRVSSCDTPRDFFQKAIFALWSRKQPGMRQAVNHKKQLSTMSLVSLKGLCMTALGDFHSVLVLDGIRFSSRPLAAFIKDAAHRYGIPIIAVARSCHMEDAGYLLRLFPDRSERFPLENFDRATAQKFADFASAELALKAENRADFLSQIANVSEGNPGAILSMIKMALSPKYRTGDVIKSTLLYVDFRLTKAASA